MKQIYILPVIIMCLMPTVSMAEAEDAAVVTVVDERGEGEVAAAEIVVEERAEAEAAELHSADGNIHNGTVVDAQGEEPTETISSVAASDTGNGSQIGECTPGTECVAKMVLPKEQSAERINDLQGAYNEAKKNEKSDANKILGGASMGATGAGGMMLGMGLAEQKADNAAYEQMRGYVSTFKCNYGANNIEYSVEPTQLPTSTELTNLYAEYVTLANDLKMRKSVLGLRAGLESQPILDSATSGLYDDVSSGRETGTFTSLARAILDPDGEDAKRWAEQTQKSKNLIIAGGVTAGVGAVGGIVGNVLINKDAPNLQSVREDINEINQKYEPQKQQFGNANSNPPPSPNPDDTSAGNEGA